MCMSCSVDESGELSNEMKAKLFDNIAQVQLQSKNVIDKLETATDMHIGLEMLHLFGMY